MDNTLNICFDNQQSFLRYLIDLCDVKLDFYVKASYLMYRSAIKMVAS